MNASCNPVVIKSVPEVLWQLLGSCIVSDRIGRAAILEVLETQQRCWPF